MVKLPVIHKKTNPEIIDKKGVPVIYFLLKNNKVIYIGQTRSLKSRIMMHKCHYDFDHFAFLEVDESKIFDYERRLISIFRPANNNLIPKKYRTRSYKNTGRKPIYKVDHLKEGESIEIKSKMGKFAHQIAYSCGQRYKGVRKFTAKFEGGHVFIIREI